VAGAKLTTARNSLKINAGKHLDIMQVKGEPKRRFQDSSFRFHPITKKKTKMNELKIKEYAKEKIKTEIQTS
jgi:hypothetical protein